MKAKKQLLARAVGLTVRDSIASCTTRQDGAPVMATLALVGVYEKILAPPKAFRGESSRDSRTKWAGTLQPNVRLVVPQDATRHQHTLATQSLFQVVRITAR
jgi:hypothetical protein